MRCGLAAAADDCRVNSRRDYVRNSRAAGDPCVPEVSDDDGARGEHPPGQRHAENVKREQQRRSLVCDDHLPASKVNSTTTAASGVTSVAEASGRRLARPDGVVRGLGG